MEQQPPNLAEPGKWLGYHPAKDWRLMTKPPMAFFAVFVFSIFIAWLATWQVVIPQKNEQLNTKQIIIDGKQSQIDFISKRLEDTQRENEKLQKQVEDLRIYRAQDALPIKKKALILAKQIQDFTKNWKDSDPDDIKADNVNKYLNRFGLRAQIMRDDLDQNGQQSDSFDNVMYNFSHTYEQVKLIASEIEHLAKNLPD